MKYELKVRYVSKLELFKIKFIFELNSIMVFTLSSFEFMHSKLVINIFIIIIIIIFIKKETYFEYYCILLIYNLSI